jgi:hypothetical protein
MNLFKMVETVLGPQLGPQTPRNWSNLRVRNATGVSNEHSNSAHECRSTTPPSLAATGRYWCRTAHIDATATPFPEKYLVARAGPFCRQARPQYRGTPYSTATDPEPMSTVLRVLSCGPEWAGAE